MGPMKVAILCGGLGTRLREETEVRPKPMIEIGGRPILWHIMRGYAAHGFREFVLALGYKGEAVKRYFLDYYHLQGHLTVSLASGGVEAHEGEREDWTVHLVDTGLGTQTGGRVKRLAEWLRGGTFMLTYGDGVADVNPADVLAFHKKHGKLATVTAVRPPARFGGLLFNGDLVSEFTEKPQVGEGWINGGFFVMEPAGLEEVPRPAHVGLECRERRAVGHSHDRLRAQVEDRVRLVGVDRPLERAEVLEIPVHHGKAVHVAAAVEL